MFNISKFFGYLVIILGALSGVALFLLSILGSEKQRKSLTSLWVLFIMGAFFAIFIFGTSRCGLRF